MTNAIDGATVPEVAGLRTGRATSEVAVLLLFTVAIFGGAVLVFGVQPIAARLLLPYFGGSPAVWNASSLFFQLALLGGYAYSYLLTQYLSPKLQAVVHVPVLVVPLLWLPIALPVGDSWIGSLPPALGVVGGLAIGLGLPFAVASTTGPLLQRWFSFTKHPSAADPYFLYAASNTGSLLVLVSYPFLIEPRWDLPDQSVGWSVGYVIFAIAAGGCALVALRSAPHRLAPTSTVLNHDLVSWITRARWLLLAAVPAALSLGVTQHISTDIAAIPLLWIAPLSLYLLSFVFAFSPRNPLRPELAARMLPFALAALIVAPFVSLPVVVLLGVQLAFLFIAAVMCHGRLADERPDPTRLTEFYLLLSIGGAFGGAFVSLVAPVVFDRVWEYPIALGLALLLRPRISVRLSRRGLMWIGAGVLVALTMVVGSLTASSSVPSATPVVALGVVLVAISRWRLALAGAASVILGFMTIGGGEAIYTDRTFFGVYQVTSDENVHSLVHGTTVHGIQFTNEGSRSIPTTYFHRSGPIGQVFAARSSERDRIGIIGLGVGTLATYGRPGDEITFYEIDPAVVTLARDPDLFTYLADSKATLRMEVADGRLGLAASNEAYDLLVIDAFSSDAIPVHLLTREAVELYADHITDRGLIAFHITNRYLELEPVLGRIAKSLNLQALVQSDHAVTADQAADGKRPSTWVLLTRSAENLSVFSEDERWQLPAGEDGRVWTDGYSDLIGALR